ncbi:type II toxin-antitoxin system RelE/ParE family toxin [Glacieibacterium sp.]|uniref:type II toxin-antitoxin system RelE/ParE family toxin n=1 Tax=Glacieibacterium sp. TaxID=2860237 RepID=UPI003B000709
MIVIRETVEFTAWIDNLRDGAAKGRIARRLERLADGHFGDEKSVGDRVFELRFYFGPGYRIYFTRLSDGAIVLLLAGGDKDSQHRDIALAKRLADQEL